MKKRLLILTMSILSSFALAGTPYEHVQTGISLPETLGGLARGEVTPYEAAPGEAGVAIPTMMNRWR